MSALDSVHAPGQIISKCTTVQENHLARRGSYVPSCPDGALQGSGFPWCHLGRCRQRDWKCMGSGQVRDRKRQRAGRQTACLSSLWWIGPRHSGRGGPDGSVGEETACNAGDSSSIPGLGRPPGEGTGYPLQYSDLENSMDCIVHGVTKCQTWLSDSLSEWLWNTPVPLPLQGPSDHFCFVLRPWRPSDTPPCTLSHLSGLIHFYHTFLLPWNCMVHQPPPPAKC